VSGKELHCTSENAGDRRVSVKCDDCTVKCSESILLAIRVKRAVNFRVPLSSEDSLELD
jgi:hypothetical protein